MSTGWTHADADRLADIAGSLASIAGSLRAIALTTEADHDEPARDPCEWCSVADVTSFGDVEPRRMRILRPHLRIVDTESEA